MKKWGTSVGLGDGEETDRDTAVVHDLAINRISQRASVQKLVAATAMKIEICASANKPACQGARDTLQELNRALRLANSWNLYRVGAARHVQQASSRPYRTPHQFYGEFPRTLSVISHLSACSILRHGRRVVKLGPSFAEHVVRACCCWLPLWFVYGA